MKLGFFLREALRSLGRNAVPSFAALATMLVTMLVLGVFIPIVQATTGAANDVRERVLVDVYLKRDATQTDVARVSALLQRRADTSSASSSSPSSRPTTQQRKKNPEAYELLGSNPLPDTFRVTPENPDDVLTIASALAPAPPAAGARRSTARSTRSATAATTPARSSRSRAS